MNKLIIFLLLLLIGLQYQLWAEKGSMTAHEHLNDLVTQQRQKNRGLQTRNQRLAAEVADLKQGLTAIEERARLELGMIKQGEVFYQIVK